MGNIGFLYFLGQGGVPQDYAQAMTWYRKSADAGDKVAMNVGFYYMANAGGRLAGTVLSGALYEWQGLAACLWVSAGFVVIAGLLSRMLPEVRSRRTAPPAQAPTVVA